MPKLGLDKTYIVGQGFVGHCDRTEEPRESEQSFIISDFVWIGENANIAGTSMIGHDAGDYPQCICELWRFEAFDNSRTFLLNH